MPRSLPAYNSGTVTVAYTGGAWTVTGSGTNFISPDGVPNYTLVAGDMFVIPGVGFSPISAVNSASSLSLSNWTGGPVSTASSYTIYRFEGLPSNAVAALINELLTLFTDQNPPAYATIDTGAVRTKWDDDGAGNARMRVRPSNAATGDAAYALAARVNAATGVWQVAAIVGARVPVSDANYSVAAGVSTVAYTAISAARTVTLPAANSFDAGQQLLIVDESGSCSAAKTITLTPNGSDTINGGASAVVSNAYGYLVIESNAASKWTVVDSAQFPIANITGLGAGVASALANPTDPTQTRYTSGSGTYTPPAGVVWLRVRMVGGGGGGEGSGASPGAAGGGGNSTFGSSLLVANGGSAAITYVGGNGGGSSLGGTTGFAQQGGAGSGGSWGTTNAIGGLGGVSPFGGAGVSIVVAGAGSSAAANSGSGGGGAGSPQTTAAPAGGGGGAGGYVEAIIASPAATYSYAVGSGGAAGSAGTNGYAGGAGAAGQIIIEEHYFA